MDRDVPEDRKGSSLKIREAPGGGPPVNPSQITSLLWAAPFKGGGILSVNVTVSSPGYERLEFGQILNNVNKFRLLWATFKKHMVA